MWGFTFREIEALIKRGVHVELYPVFAGRGYYWPKPEWVFHNFNPALILLKQPNYLFRQPLTYIRLLAESIRTKTLLHMMIAFDFAHKMMDRGLDVIHCHFGGPVFFVGYFCKKILQLPLTVTVHASELYVGPNKLMFKRALDYCDLVTTVSDYNKQLLVNDFGIPESKIKVVRLFAPLPSCKIIILIVASFVEKKGHEFLFRTIKLLGRDDICLWVVGEGELDLRRRAEELGIGDQVLFFGVVTGEKLNSLYSACDIFCLPSVTGADGQKEGIPVSLMEAMAYSKPVITTRHAGIPELVEEVLIEEGNVEAFAQAIETLADDGNLRQRQGERNREIIKKAYSERNVDNLAETFAIAYSNSMGKS